MKQITILLLFLLPSLLCKAQEEPVLSFTIPACRKTKSPIETLMHRIFPTPPETLPTELSPAAVRCALTTRYFR